MYSQPLEAHDVEGPLEAKCLLKLAAAFAYLDFLISGLVA